MDRMASSMKQVPNPLPKVLSRRGVGTGMEAAERESFERTQLVPSLLPASSRRLSVLNNPGIIVTLHTATVPARVGTPDPPAATPSPTRPLVCPPPSPSPATSSL
uniref:Uncharacterized protein n=1 Tax=Equus asinus asinus TaxID=83772 RepID=A0A8C4MKN0_EQUAS